MLLCQELRLGLAAPSSNPLGILLLSWWPFLASLHAVTRGSTLPQHVEHCLVLQVTDHCKVKACMHVMCQSAICGRRYV
jgi:hypothetical protein